MEAIYERYHNSRKIQKKLINKNDYTYRGVLSYINKLKVNGLNILDIGCGVGSVDLYLANAGARVLGIDISTNGIKIAKQNVSKLKIRNAKFRKISFPNKIPNDKYDIILCLEVLEHLNNDYDAVSKIRKLLKKDGILIASSPSINSVMYRMGLLNKFDTEVGHLRRYSEKSFCTLFLKAKFKIVDIKKTQGILRDFLFTTRLGGFALKFVNKWPLSGLANLIDDLLVILFGESDLFVMVKK